MVTVRKTSLQHPQSLPPYFPVLSIRVVILRKGRAKHAKRPDFSLGFSPPLLCGLQHSPLPNNTLARPKGKPALWPVVCPMPRGGGAVKGGNRAGAAGRPALDGPEDPWHLFCPKSCHRDGSTDNKKQSLRKETLFLFGTPCRNRRVFAKQNRTELLPQLLSLKTA